MMGDPSHDLQMAQNAGCPSLAVSYGAHGADGLERFGPLAVVHSVPELHAWLIKHG
jgi:phosphoglycolate phosphatase